MKILVGFFGLNRSLKWTSSSISSNILGPLRAGGHDLAQMAIVNPRSQEIGVKIRSRECLEELLLDVVWVEAQKAPDPLLFELSMSKQDWMTDPDGRTRKNLLLQLYSLSQLWKLIELVDPYLFDFFVFLRPDPEYIDELDPNIILDLSSGVDLITPAWHQWGGLNDRFAFCSLRGAIAYTKRRYDMAPQAIRSIGALHPESLLSFVARESRLCTKTTSMKARRVRGNGLRLQEDFSL